jgi:beta-galactosidase/beta-glucuronidase
VVRRAVFLRCDGAYGRGEVVVNGALAAVHGSGATSFDVDLTPFLRAADNALAITSPSTRRTPCSTT